MKEVWVITHLHQSEHGVGVTTSAWGTEQKARTELKDEVAELMESYKFKNDEIFTSSEDKFTALTKEAEVISLQISKHEIE